MAPSLTKQSRRSLCTVAVMGNTVSTMSNARKRAVGSRPQNGPQPKGRAIDDIRVFYDALNVRGAGTTIGTDHRNKRDLQKILESGGRLQ